MKQLKIAILWHQHQPWYKMENEFILPWVRLHGVKDYPDLAELLFEFPSIKQTFNLVPSLMMQVEEYTSGNTIDKIQRLTSIPPNKLNLDEKYEILRLFFLNNPENMILPYPRFKELFEKGKNRDNAVNDFTDNDWLDLQVWYNLSWFGQISKMPPSVRRLFNKGRNFTEDEKEIMMKRQLDVLSKIKPTMQELKKLGQIEISVTPMYHPILPLVCDTMSSLESMPDLPVKESIYKYPEDALNQIIKAINYYEQMFGEKPTGMWPSEGSISNESLGLLIKSGIKWAASDEGVLAKSMKQLYKQDDKYFPKKFKTTEGEINLFFRDHNLSDAIGFVYSRWKPEDAAYDFVNRFKSIRKELVKNHGEECLDYAVVPVILDGENCWEFYPENGFPFLRKLYSLLSDSVELKTITFSEAISENTDYYNNELSSKYLNTIVDITAGSWINADFKIWFGHEDDRTAWRMLANVRKQFDEMKDKISIESYNKAMEEIYIAEGSDWFWWYGDEHVAENKSDFDVMFRYHIREIYKHIGIEPPEETYIPIGKDDNKPRIIEQSGDVKPVIDGKFYPGEWDKAGYYDATGSMTAMHQVGELIHRIWFASDVENLYFRCDKTRKFNDEDIIEFMFLSPKRFSVFFKHNSVNLSCEDDFNISSFSAAKDEIIEFSISKKSIFSKNLSADCPPVNLIVRTKTKDGDVFYPRQGKLELKM